MDLLHGLAHAPTREGTRRVVVVLLVVIVLVLAARLPFDVLIR